jgi:hypothetical protein
VTAFRVGERVRINSGWDYGLTGTIVDKCTGGTFMVAVFTLNGTRHYVCSPGALLPITANNGD